jgi:hypothetical protein
MLEQRSNKTETKWKIKFKLKIFIIKYYELEVQFCETGAFRLFADELNFNKNEMIRPETQNIGIKLLPLFLAKQRYLLILYVCKT